MTESQYDAFLFASLCETDEMTLSVLSVLARQDVDPWQEAARLAQLSRDQAINSLASKIWKSNSERGSPSEASRLAARLIELLPSHSRPPSQPRRADDGNGRLNFGSSPGCYLCLSPYRETACRRPRTPALRPSVSTTVQEEASDTIVPRDRNGLRHRR